MRNEKENSLLRAALELRLHAEERMGFNCAQSQALESKDRTSRLDHELEIHQIELEMQNTELRQVRGVLETALAKYTDLYDFAPVGYFTLDVSGTITAVNLCGANLIGTPRSQLLGRRLGQFVTEKSRPEFNAFLTAVFTCTGRKSSEIMLQNKESLPLYVQLEAVCSISGQECSLALIDVTGRRQAEEKLLRARKLETIGQIAAGVAHEVRNPLHAILSISEALFKEQVLADSPEFDPYIEHIRTQINRLSFIMNSLLDLGKTIPVARILPVPLYEVCQESIDLWNLSGSAHKIPVTLSVDPAALKSCVMADRGRLIQILFNLLENAAQHSPVNAKIVLSLMDSESCSPTVPMAIIRITDSGSGILPENLSRLFDPFYSDRPEGTGLGLALVKSFVEELGGTVRLFNNDPPPGCSAEVHIPKALEKNP